MASASWNACSMSGDQTPSAEESSPAPVGLSSVPGGDCCCLLGVPFGAGSAAVPGPDEEGLAWVCWCCAESHVGDGPFCTVCCDELSHDVWDGFDFESHIGATDILMLPAAQVKSGCGAGAKTLQQRSTLKVCTLLGGACGEDNTTLSPTREVGTGVVRETTPATLVLREVHGMGGKNAKYPSLNFVQEPDNVTARCYRSRPESAHGPTPLKGGENEPYLRSEERWNAWNACYERRTMECQKGGSVCPCVGLLPLTRRRHNSHDVSTQGTNRNAIYDCVKLNTYAQPCCLATVLAVRSRINLASVVY